MKKCIFMFLAYLFAVVTYADSPIDNIEAAPVGNLGNVIVPNSGNKVQNKKITIKYTIFKYKMDTKEFIKFLSNYNLEKSVLYTQRDYIIAYIFCITC